MDDIKAAKTKPHSINLEGREKLYITGITDVDSFNDTTVIVGTQMGELVIKGEELSISNLDVENGDVMIKGLIHSMVYESKAVNKSEKGFFKSLFK
ncbi:MAG TPA: sporulation protein YabP [Clostridiales bacterium]|nr:sporulation protein YabP [Clostridiales bacterium]